MSARKRQKTPEKFEHSKDCPLSKSGEEESTGRVGVPYRRLIVRTVVAITLLVCARFYLGPPEKDHTLVRSSEKTPRTFYPVPCSSDYNEELEVFKGCVPTKCGRVIMDGVVTRVEAYRLLKIAEAGLAHGGSTGGASILDLHSGALSKGHQFINIYEMMKSTGQKIFTDEDFNLYRRVKNKIHNLIVEEFGIPILQTKLYLTKPTFFSRMTTRPAFTVHDEYWHPHVDKKTYGSFHYTSLLYLSTYRKDFTGGRFIFIDKDANRTVEPRLGRVSFFTSGSENLHYVEKLQSGTRYAITISFTCDPDQAISDPKMKTS